MNIFNLFSKSEKAAPEKRLYKYNAQKLTAKINFDNLDHSVVIELEGIKPAIYSWGTIECTATKQLETMIKNYSTSGSIQIGDVIYPWSRFHSLHIQKVEEFIRSCEITEKQCDRCCINWDKLERQS